MCPVYAVGADPPIAETPIDTEANSKVALQVARQGIVLVKNDGLLPLVDKSQKILVFGRYSDRAVWSGGGSPEVTPHGGPALRLPFGGSPFLNVNGFQVLTPSSPLSKLRTHLPNAIIEFDTGYDPTLAAVRAANADLVIALDSKWQVENLDSAVINLPEGQDAMISALATANPNTIIVLETGNQLQCLTARRWRD